MAVIVASLTAGLAESVTADAADAIASLIVSVIIMVSLLPLFRGLVGRWFQLLVITKELRVLAKNKDMIVANMADQDISTTCDIISGDQSCMRTANEVCRVIIQVPHGQD